MGDTDEALKSMRKALEAIEASADTMRRAIADLEGGGPAGEGPGEDSVKANMRDIVRGSRGRGRTS